MNEQTASAENDNSEYLKLPEKLFINNSKYLNLPEELFINLSEEIKRIPQKMQIDLTLHKLTLTK